MAGSAYGQTICVAKLIEREVAILDLKKNLLAVRHFDSMPPP